MQTTRLLRAILLATACSASMAVAAQSNEVRQVDVPAGELATALDALRKQTGDELMYRADQMRGVRTGGVRGSLTLDAALHQLLRDTGYGLKRDASGAVLIMKQKDSVPPVVTPQRRGNRAVEDGQESESDIKELSEVVVTGTRLRGFAPESSPMQMYSRSDILESGVSTTEQFIRTLPQNFGGGSTEFTGNGLPNDANATLNYSFGTGANLRGLGSGSTLVLLNGNRLAPTSTIGDFVDLSLIPISALERIDVLTDGASSIYGGDAVAGVINFVLREDFEGAETAIRYGSVTSGSSDEYRISQTLGTHWGYGNILGTYEYFRRGNLTLEDRPGISAPNLANGGLITSRDLFDLMPRQERHSVVVALNQELTPSIKVSVSGLYSRRKVDHSGINFTGAGLLVNTNADVESMALSASAQKEISARWLVSLGAGFSQLRNDQQRKVLGPASPSDFEFDSDTKEIDLVVNGDLVDLPGGSVKLALGGHFREEKFVFANTATQVVGRSATREVSALYGEVLVPLVGHSNAKRGLKRLEVNLSGRIDDYSDFGTAAKPKIGVLWAPSEKLMLRSSYSQSFAPPPLGRVGDKQSAVSVIPTSFVTTVLGLAGQYPSLEGTNHITVLGVSDALEAQTSKAFTAGFDYKVDRQSHSWLVRANYYDIQFENRLGQVPMPGNASTILAPFLAIDNPGAFPEGTVIFFPAQEEVDALVSSVDLPVQLLQGATLENIGIVNHIGVIRNLASTKTRGMDLQVSYDVDTNHGLMSMGFNANRIIDFTQQAVVVTPQVNAVSTLYNPVNLQLRAHVGIAKNGFSWRAFMNHTAGYQVDNTGNAATVASWTTTDLTMSYTVDAGSRSWWRGTTLGLSIVNLFDKGPPSTPTLGQFQLTGYDPTNASPLGRFMAFEIRKAF